VAKQIVEHHLEVVTAVVSGKVIQAAEPVVVAVVVEIFVSFRRFVR
jgi:hypothetical protein